MANTRRSWTSAVVMAAVVSLLTNSVLFASENEPSSTETTASQAPAESAFNVPSTSPVPTEFSRLTLPEGFVENPSLAEIPNGAYRKFKFTPKFTPEPSSAFAGQIYQGRPYKINRDGSIAALMLGSIAAIAGTAVLVYANRPECTTNQFAGGCGYGTKVVGGAVLTGGVVGLVIGALTWR
jgi:hypothetical protein